LYDLAESPGSRCGYAYYFFALSKWLLTYAQKILVSAEIAGARISKTALEEAAGIVKKDDG